jgi:hypothetical protein
MIWWIIFGLVVFAAASWLWCNADYDDDDEYPREQR